MRFIYIYSLKNQLTSQLYAIYFENFNVSFIHNYLCN